MLDFSCPRCGQKYQADENHIGKNIKCTDCGDIVSIGSQDGSYRRVPAPMQMASPKPNLKRSTPESSTFLRSKRLPAWQWTLVAASSFLGLVLAYSLFRFDNLHHQPDTDGFVPDKTSDRIAPLAARENASADTLVPSDKVPSLVPPQSNQFDLFGQPPPPNISDRNPSSRVGARGNLPITRLAHSETKTAQESRPPAHSLPSGTNIFPEQATSGHGELEANNGTNDDACVIVIDLSTESRVREVYVQWRNSATLSHLNQGSYKVLFTTGMDWNETEERFNREPSYFEFGKTLSFTESRDAEAIHYSHHSITLNPVRGGNVHSIQISEAQFHALSKR